LQIASEFLEGFGKLVAGQPVLLAGWSHGDQYDRGYSIVISLTLNDRLLLEERVVGSNIKGSWRLKKEERTCACRSPVFPVASAPPFSI